MAFRRRGRQRGWTVGQPARRDGRGACCWRPVFVVPHRRWREGNYQNWNYLTTDQARGDEVQIFAAGSWGGDWHPDFVPQNNDVVIAEHWAQSGFANTDLDFQLKQHGITHVVSIGMLANTCIESTSRFAMELGYHVTLVRGATVAWTREMLHAATN